jgi:hypothetical protein
MDRAPRPRAGGAAVSIQLGPSAKSRGGRIATVGDMAMLRRTVAVIVLALGASQFAAAQEPDKAAQPPVHAVPSMVTPTPEMWFYEQELRRYEDPKLAVRRNAEMAAAQRAHRLAAMKWFGLSNSRPVASPVPFYSSYSPSWTGNSYDPYRWVGAGSPAILIYSHRP